jgi:hypothetical protein
MVLAEGVNSGAFGSERRRAKRRRDYNAKSTDNNTSSWNLSRQKYEILH